MFPKIGDGSTRKVFDLGDGTVVKVCHALDHGSDVCPCLKEIEVWAAFLDHPRLVPVIEGGLHWVRMPKIDKDFTSPLWQTYTHACREIPPGVGDYGSSNWSPYKGMLRMHDYGCYYPKA